MVPIWEELCVPQIHVLKAEPPVPEVVIALGDRAFQKVLKIK
jgi:hypothetical protein